MFAWLSVTIIATRRRPVFILHVEAKNAKMDCKNEIYAKNWIRSIWTAKVNYGKKSTVKVNPQSKSPQVNNLSMITLADVVGDVSRCGRWCQQVTWQWWCHLGLTSIGADLVCGGAWRKYSMRGGAWRKYLACGGAWRSSSARGAREALTQNLWEACKGAWRLRWLRGFHWRVDRLKTILVIPLEMQSEQYKRQWRHMQ